MEVLATTKMRLLRILFCRRATVPRSEGHAGWLTLLALLLLPSGSPAEPPPSEAHEYEVKAGFLAAFTQFTTWPSNTFATRSAPIILGILGEDPFGEVLDNTARKQAGEHPLQIRRVKTVEEAMQCHLVFIARSENKNENAWLETLKAKPILTVGESGQTIKGGGILEFVIEGKHVRYEASWPAMQRAGLKIGAPMLASAKKVHQPPTTKP